MSIEIEARGVKYPVEVTGAGVFITTVNGTQLRADTLATLREKAVKQSAQADLTIPFTYFDNAEPWQGTARRLHANGRDILVTRDGLGATIVRGYDANHILARLDEGQFSDLQRLWAAKQSADAALDGFTQAHKRNIRSEIQAAQG